MNDNIRENAIDMMNIMIERIKTAAEAGEPNGDIRTFRTAGANFMLYFLDILTSEEHEEYERKIFHPFD